MRLIAGQLDEMDMLGALVDPKAKLDCLGTACQATAKKREKMKTNCILLL